MVTISSFTAVVVARTGREKSAMPGSGDADDTTGGKGMRRATIAIPVVILGLLLGTVGSADLQAQEGGQFTDFRGRSYTEEDLAKSLFEQTPSDRRTRGIGPAQSQQAPPSASSAGKTSIALNVFFEFNSDKILQGYYGDLDKLGKVLTAPQYSAYRVQVEGHTDNIGSDSYNRRLSENRAKSVKQYLVQHFSIPSDRLVVRGLGESKPIASNDTPEGRDKNRRVEIVNLGTN
jgi:outer membrane protein OmpA-like peptidoglycan-associated protein